MSSQDRKDRKVNLREIIGRSSAQVDRSREQQVASKIAQPTSQSTPAQTQATGAYTGAQAAPSATPTPSSASYSQTPESQSSSYQNTMSTTKNVLSSDVEIKGSLKFSNDLVVDGSIEGEVTSDNGSLIVGENAYIKGEISTQKVTIFGKVEGNVKVTERCEIKTNAELLGDIQAATLTMEEGAIFSGQSRVGKAASAAGNNKPSGNQQGGNKSGQQQK